MKNAWWMLVVVAMACQKSEVVSDFTGNQAEYALTQTSTYAVSGTVQFKERKDGAVTIVVQLKGTSGNESLPVHLHTGDVTSNGQGIVAQLNPVSAKTGTSTTVITSLADGSTVTYGGLMKVSAYLNVHASSSGPESAIILVAGNVGAANSAASAARQLGNCVQP